MNDQSFPLQPFTLTPALASLKLVGTVIRRDPMLHLTYTLQGAVDAVVIPPPTQPPMRQHNLWQHTCFEFFLGIKDATQYWEFNISPKGHWNVYRFENYRQGMTEEIAVTSLPIDVKVTPSNFSVSLDFDLNGFRLQGQPVELALSAVLQTKTGDLSYWALTHCAQTADFHRRDGFTIFLEAGQP